MLAEHSGLVFILMTWSGRDWRRNDYNVWMIGCCIWKDYKLLDNSTVNKTMAYRILYTMYKVLTMEMFWRDIIYKSVDDLTNMILFYSLKVYFILNKTNEVKFWLTIYSYFDVSMIMVIVIKKNKYLKKSHKN
jgi:hypothetical protein